MSDTQVRVDTIAHNLSDPSTNGIVLGIRSLIRSGVLPVGAKLPPIRDIATELGVSPATVAAAWKRLQKQRILEGRGRNGTWVRSAHNTMAPKRLASTGNFGTETLGLHLSVPDPLLLPRLDKALLHATSAQGLNSYERTAIVPELVEAVQRFWPYEPEAFLATSGGYSAIHTLFHALDLTGAKVAIEHPTALRHLDILEDLGATIIPVECDTQGPRPDSLALALTQQPTAFLFQPRLNSVTGQTVSPARIAQMAKLLSGTTTIVIEDDGLSDLAAIAPQSIGTWLPTRVVHVHSFSKTLGPDLRMAVVSGPKALLEQIRGYRLFSSGWTSRILQSAVAYLLTDPETQDSIPHTREQYDIRRRNLTSALQQNGVIAEDGQGLCTWVSVASERYAMITLASRGIAVAPGENFGLTALNRLRIATATLPSDQLERVTRAIVLAAEDPS